MSKNHTIPFKIPMRDFRDDLREAIALLMKDGDRKLPSGASYFEVLTNLDLNRAFYKEHAERMLLGWLRDQNHPTPTVCFLKSLEYDHGMLVCEAEIGDPQVAMLFKLAHGGVA